MPNACTGKVNEILEIYEQVPKSHYKLKSEFDPYSHYKQPEFIEVYESCDLEKIVTFIPMAFDRKTGEIVDAIFGNSDLYELWLGQPITRANVYTAMIRTGFKGSGTFSALNIIGQLSANFNGIKYYEGTGI